MQASLRLILPLVMVGCVDLARPAELVDPAPTDPDAASIAGGHGGVDAGLGVDVDVGEDAPATDAASIGAGGAATSDASEPEPAKPVLAENGRPCGAAATCQSGQCVDGFCCEGACPGSCMACDVAGAEGHCSPVPAGEDPAEECQPDPARSCGLDGTCNGAGAYRKYPVGTECAAGGCLGATEIAAATCSAAGTCQLGGTRSCAPNVCNGDSCASQCSDRSPCLNGFFCDGTTCRRRLPDGAACTGRGGQCRSGQCVDGVCCATECGRSCFACNLPGRAGTCAPVGDGGDDPRGFCTAQAQVPCGRVGGCNGRGGCKLSPAGTACAAGAGCSGGVLSGPASCDGAGHCDPGAGRSCSPFLCDGAACATACTTDAQCHAGFFCVRGACAAAKIARLEVHDQDNAAGWSAQRNFQPGQAGAHPWSDFPDTFVASVDTALSALLGREWLRVVAESKKFDDGPQATVTLSAPSDVYLVVDDRWGSKPDFTAGFADTGAKLRVFESDDRPDLSFSVYRKAGQSGAVDLPAIGSNKAYDVFVVVD